MLRVLVLMLCVTSSTLAVAKVYKLVLPDGSVQYSDTPQPGAEEVELPPVQTFTPPPTPAGDRGPGGQPSDDGQGYESVKIASPRPDETLRDNGGTVSVSVALDPPLKPGHTVEILLDGQSIGSGAATSASVTDVDRGTHSVSAVIKDGAGSTVGTAPAVTFHLKRAAVGGARPAQSLPGGAGGAAGGAGAGS